MKTILTILILCAGGLCALVFLLTPAGQATVTLVTAKLQPAPPTAVATEMPKLNEDDLPPPISGEAAQVEAKPALEPAPAAPAETGPDDTFERVMAVYEEDSKVQAGANVSKD